MTDIELIGMVPGAKDVIDWFGYWPNFHDGEVLSVALHRSKPSSLVVHGFHMTNEVDEHGFYRLSKHATVTFFMDQVIDTNLQGFRDGNIIADLALSRQDESLRVEISTSYGLAGTIDAKLIAVELQPGIPPDSRYLANSGGTP